MVVRSAVGALVAVGVLGAVALALPETTSPKKIEKAEAPYGVLPKLPLTDSKDAASSLGDPSKLVKLASLTPDQAQITPSAPQVAPAAALVDPASAAETAVPASPATPTSAAVEAVAAPETAEPNAVAALDAPTTFATEPKPASAADSVPTKPVPSAKTKVGSVNINKASADALDHLPGGGHIGHSIVSHRPYRTIADLVHKRVLRMSDFQKIEGSVTVD